MILLLFCSNNIIAQSQTFNGKSYPTISIESVIHWLNMSRQNWQSQMQAYNFDKQIYSEGSPKFMLYLNSDFSQVLSITKDFGTLEIQLMNISSNPSPKILQDLYNQLEPFFVEKDKGSNVFKFRYENVTYQFYVGNLERGDMIFVKKI